MPLVTQMLAKIDPSKALATILHFVSRHPGGGSRKGTHFTAQKGAAELTTIAN